MPNMLNYLISMIP